MKYLISDDSEATQTIEAVGIEDALAQACAWLAEGYYTERTRVAFTVYEILEDGLLGDPTRGEVWAGPSSVDPACIESYDHEWCAPLWLGGDPQNPGVFSTLGITVRVCHRCGTYRQTKKATGLHDPEEAPERVTYFVADIVSLAWTAC